MVADYIKPPRPKDVLEARQLIIETIDKLSYDQLRELAKSIHTASTNALLAGINGKPMRTDIPTSIPEVT